MRKALIAWGGWEGHEPRQCAEIVAGMLSDDGFAVEVVEGTAAFADAGLSELSLIVPVITQAKIEKAELDNLCAAVEGGIGLGGFHGGMGDSFRDQIAYHFMVGGQWVAHPGDIIDYRVEVTAPDDPIMEGVGSFEYRSEQYFMHVDPGNEVLATTTFDGTHAPWLKGTVMPVVWKRRHGAGRVFYSALGHVAAEFEVPEMATVLRRGLNWAAR
ncbi:ThuA domain-containing protein [Pelagibacterium halotolerans]|uniref:ThuA domain-containing protein n=1 Tax=Pelagibacterium halotolerans TaxID=531813 RepID=UPI0038504391